ncbi:unnamed protein product [Gongylonema pulchrum]|uniref:Flavodoxin-like domain-containing protein n=1 Tax=Gongylonema pulchrum TaxID=637853 RepID=A0A183DB17_9BILA|nr:unnamed protein product [Gongylonema pulchrum]
MVISLLIIKLNPRRFRSKEEIEPSDHPLGPGKIFVIYAKGQTTGHHSHAVKSALEQGPVKNHDFYKRDQVKYHGCKFYRFSTNHW